MPVLDHDDQSLGGKWGVRIGSELPFLLELRALSTLPEASSLLHFVCAPSRWWVPRLIFRFCVYFLLFPLFCRLLSSPLFYYYVVLLSLSFLISIFPPLLTPALHRSHRPCLDFSKDPCVSSWVVLGLRRQWGTRWVRLGWFEG